MKWETEYVYVINSTAHTQGLKLYRKRPKSFQTDFVSEPFS